MDSFKDKYFKRNAASVAAVEFFWGLGFPVIIESTFLQIFLKNYGASDFLIGLVPSILILGISIFPLASSYLTRTFEYQKTVVLNLHIISSFAILFFGVFLFFVKDTSIILPVFFISYVIFSMCIGFTLPLWLNFLVKIFSSGKSVQGLSIMNITQNIAKIIASIVIIKTVETYSFSLYSAAWIFLGSGISLLIGSFFFIFAKELPSEKNQLVLKESFFVHIKKTVVEIVKNKNLLKYLIGDLDYYVILTITSFYAVYATQFFEISNHSAAGLFVVFIYIGSILANLLLGTFDLMTLKNKFLSTKILGLFTLMLLIFSPSFTGFLVASFLMGFSRGTRSIIYPPCIKKIVGKEDVTPVFAASPLVTIVFASGFPLIFGLILDNFASLGSSSYKIMFGVSFCIISIVLIVGVLTNFDDQLPQHPLN